MKRNDIIQIFSLIILGLFSACSPQGGVIQSVGEIETTKSSKTDATKAETVYHIFQNNQFVVGELDKEPIPFGGEKEFHMRIFRDFRYPVEARRKGVSGIVTVTIVINEFGKLEHSEINHGIGSGCDEEALAAVRRGCQAGFEPAMLNDKAVKVKYDIPVNFRVH